MILCCLQSCIISYGNIRSAYVIAPFCTLQIYIYLITYLSHLTSHINTSIMSYVSKTIKLFTAQMEGTRCTHILSSSLVCFDIKFCKTGRQILTTHRTILCDNNQYKNDPSTTSNYNHLL